MELNRPLIEKMIKRIEEKPETYDQGDYGRHARPDEDRQPDCGTIACLAGEAIICSEDDPATGIKKLFELMYTPGNEPDATAAKLMGIDPDIADGLFCGGATGWPEPYQQQIREARDYEEEAMAAVNLLRAILRTDGKILGQ